MRKTRVFQLKLDDEEFADLHHKAAEAGLSASELIRERVGLATLAKLVKPPERLKPKERLEPAVIPAPKGNEAAVPAVVKAPEDNQQTFQKLVYRFHRGEGMTLTKAEQKARAILEGK